MALLPKIDRKSVNKTATEIVVTETTGNYNSSTNLGGYGAPNINRSDVDLAVFLVHLMGEDASSQIQKYLDAATTPTLMNFLNNTTDLILDSESMGQPSGVAFRDGEQVITYLVLVATANTATVFEDQVTGSAGSNFVTEFASLDYLVINNIAYEIDRTSITTKAMLLKNPVPVSVSGIYYSGYQHQLKVLIIENGRNCVVEGIGTLPTESKDCGLESGYNTKADQLYNLLMATFAAELDHNCGNYQGANATAQMVQNECARIGCCCANC